jgi:hypothetical protein
MPGPCIEEDERDGKEEKGELNLDDLIVLCETLLSLLFLLIVWLSLHQSIFRRLLTMIGERDPR